MKIPPWYVLTGGPSSGKTTLLKELQKLGYHTVRETARDLVDEYERKGIPAKALRKNEKKFQEMVLERKFIKEKRIPRNRIEFFDRGIPDSIAYSKICGLGVKEIEKISRKRYRKIFFLEQLPFQKDYARTENRKTVRRIGRLLKAAYKKLGYDIIFVPAVSVEKRLNIVLSHVSHTGSKTAMQ